MLHKNERWFEPIAFKTNVVFVTVATLFLALTGWLTQTSRLPSLIETSLSQRYSPWNNFVPLAIWMQLAVILSLILPVFILLVCWNKAIVRRMMLLYVVVMLIHIATEMIFNKLALSSMNFIVGFTYTSYKVPQLWCYQQQIGKQNNLSGIRRTLIMMVLVSGLIFWTMNWLFLGINLVTRIAGA